MNRLTTIANECGTDKGLMKDECHGYTEYYQYWLNKFRFPKILEIGSWHGGSTRMFDEFYEGDCEIWTYDIDYCVYEYKKNVGNVHCFRGNQNSKADWDLFFETAPDKFDIIIDDGSHQPEHQIHTLYWLYSHLEHNGIYILEDLHTYMWDEREHSPLYMLNFWDDNKFLSPAQRDELFDHLDDEIIIHRRNPKSTYCGRSITSILRFKQ